jgi:hypothetical protein
MSENGCSGGRCWRGPSEPVPERLTFNGAEWIRASEVEAELASLKKQLAATELVAFALLCECPDLCTVAEEVVDLSERYERYLGAEGDAPRLIREGVAKLLEVKCDS